MTAACDVRSALDRLQLEDVARRHFLDSKGPLRIAGLGGEGVLYGMLVRIWEDQGSPETWRFDLNRRPLALWHDGEVRAVNSLIWEWIAAGILQPFTQIRPSESPMIWDSVILTDVGRERLGSDHPIPERPSAYLSELYDKAPHLSQTERFYVRESILAFNARFFPASLVMLGCAAESLIGRIAENAVSLVPLAKQRVYLETVANGSIARVWSALRGPLEQHWSTIGGRQRAISETAFNQLFLVTKVMRDDGGHPQDTPVDLERSRPVLLGFPEAARIGCKVLIFVTDWGVENRVQ